jgi:hypothetical protein
MIAVLFCDLRVDVRVGTMTASSRISNITMSDQSVSYAQLSLKGEKVSIASPSIAPSSTSLTAANASIAFLKWMVANGTIIPWGVGSLCVAVASWAAPALLLYRYSPDQLFDLLTMTPVRGSGGDLLTLLAALGYFVASGLLLGRAVARLGRPWSLMRIVLRTATAPLILLSLAATMTTAVAFFLGLLLRFFPTLL